MEENHQARRLLDFRMYNRRLGTLLAVASTSDLLALVPTVLSSIRVFLVVRHRSRASGCLLVDGPGDRHTDQGCLGVLDCMGPKTVGKEVDSEELVEGCARTYWLVLADKICVGSLYLRDTVLSLILMRLPSL